MTLHVIYSNATGSTQDLTTLDTIRLPGLSVTTNAEEGSVAISNLVVDDIGATLDLVGLRRVYIWESAEDALNQMIWTGFLGAREISRGPGQPPDDDTFVLSTDRRWSCELVDVNSLFSRRIITGADGNRPAETDVQRIAWLISTNYVFTVGTGNSAGYFNQSGGIAMDAADLRGQTGFDVMNDCAQRSGKNWFMFYDEGTDTAPSTYIGHMSLFYDFVSSTIYSSTLRLTNVDADVDDSTTFAVLPDAILRRSPERVYSGIYLPYDGGTLYAQRAATGDTFAYRDASAPNSNVKTTAKAAQLAARYLNTSSTEADRITCRFVVPKEKVNHLKEGQRVQVKFSHLPGLSATYSYARCLRRTVLQRSDENYEIEVELSPLTPVCEVMGYDGTAYTVSVTNTPAGSYPPNSGQDNTNDCVPLIASGLVFYMPGGGGCGAPSQQPLTGRPHPNSTGRVGGGLSFRRYGHLASSMPLGWYDGGLTTDANNQKFRVYLVGFGRVTVWLYPYNGGIIATAKLWKITTPIPSNPNADVWTLLETTTLGAAGSVSFDVPDDGTCFHCVVIYESAEAWGYGGFDWAPF